MNFAGGGECVIDKPPHIPVRPVSGGGGNSETDGRTLQLRRRQAPSLGFQRRNQTPALHLSS